MAIAMPAAMRPYSIAVAPDSSLTKPKMSDFMAVQTLVFPAWNCGSSAVPIRELTGKNLSLL
jgi:hypothetical protein